MSNKCGLLLRSFDRSFEPEATVVLQTLHAALTLTDVVITQTDAIDPKQRRPIENITADADEGSKMSGGSSADEAQTLVNFSLD